MGLDMYLYKAPKNINDAIAKLELEEEEELKKFNEVFALIPLSETDNGLDMTKMTDEQKELYDKFIVSYQNRREKLYEYMLDSHEVAYWRKFNALHGYIVKNFANDVDESMQKIYLSLDNLKQILSDLNLTKEKLMAYDKDVPMKPCSGFFFGHTEMDMHYCELIQNAIELFTELIENFNPDIENVWYQASW